MAHPDPFLAIPFVIDCGEQGQQSGREDDEQKAQVQQWNHEDAEAQEPRSGGEGMGGGGEGSGGEEGGGGEGPV